MRWFLAAIVVIVFANLFAAVVTHFTTWLEYDTVVKAVYAGFLGLFAVELDYTKNALERMHRE